MGHIKTSANFYSRGIPNNIPVFGAYVLANYDVVKPYSLYKLNSNYYDFAFQNKNANKNVNKRK
jgi:hypothetical protein